MRWNKPVLALGFALAIVVLCSVTFIAGAAPEQQLTVYAAQGSYSLSIMDRGGKPYIAVADLLSPLGASSPQLKGKEWRLELNKAEARFTEDKDKALIRGHQADLSGKVLVEDGRLLVPMEAALPLLSRLLNTTVDFHQPSRRIFVGNTLTHFHAEFKNQDQPVLTLNFSQSVKPETSHEQDHTTLIFRKEPLISSANKQQFGDGAIQSLTYSEENGTALLTVTGNAALQVTRSDDGKTITLQPEKPAAAEAQENEPTPQGTSATTEAQPHAPEFFVMIDPSHGGYDKGASFGGRLNEKDITLRLARELYKELEERGIASRLLRDGDIELGLERRAEITNEQHAGMYVALHAGRPGKGVRVYAPFLTDPQQPAGGRFMPWESAQSGALTRSQTAAQAVAIELRKKGLTASALGLPLRPLNNIVAPAIAVELAPDGDDLQSLENQRRQNSVASGIASGIAQVRSQMGGHQ
ncbi:MAG TPA: N-acetylmuramoyl-L-alanine amidase [Candidatus Angelobacter sp.]|jgi:N-acetylmuramoyl-L-alanine amidase